MASADRGPLVFDSGAPFHLRLVVERIGDDLVARIAGAAGEGLAALAFSEWDGSRARTRFLSTSPGRGEGIARHLAHALAGAARARAAAMVALAEERTTGDVAAAAFALARDAALAVKEQRLRFEVERDGSLFSRIDAGRTAEVGPLAAAFATPVGALLAANDRRIREIHRRHFGGRVRLFAPLYLGNACTNDCVYCGFRRSSEFARSVLSRAEAVREAAVLAERGFRAVDLVTGEIPTDAFVAAVADAVQAILAETPITRIHLNLGSLSTAQYRTLREAGALGYHLYQETYDRDAFFRLHRSGGKREMAARLEGPFRAAEAGFESLGLGILLGAAALPQDLAALASHASLLAEAHPGLSLGFSLPRMQTMDADRGYVPDHPVGDDDFVRAFVFLRLRFPSAHLTVTTREGPAMRDLLLGAGATKISAGVSTAPGGYAAPSPSASDAAEAREQFRVTDTRSAEEVFARILALGLRPVFAEED